MHAIWSIVLMLLVTTSWGAATGGGKGRHDPCVLPRAVPIVESMMALVLVDHALRQRGQTGEVQGR